MERANLLPPTFESDHSRNQFTIRLLLHHFLGADDIGWLANFSQFEMNENQKRGLIFLKEVGAIDNSSYRQLNGVDTLKASADLRELRRKDILLQKGKGKATYYVGGPSLDVASAGTPVAPADILNTPPPDLTTPADALNTPPPGLTAPVNALNTSPYNEVPDDLILRITQLGKRVNDPQRVKDLIKELCLIRAWKASEIARFFHKEEDYFKRKYLSEMIAHRELVYVYPEMINHPEQAYLTHKSDDR